MKAFLTSNGNYLVKNKEEFAFFSKDGIFLRYSDESEYEFAEKTWGTGEISVKFNFPEGVFNSPFSKEFFAKQFLIANNVNVKKINYLTFVDSYDFQIPEWLKSVKNGIVENCNFYEPAGNNVYDRGSYSYFQLESFSINEDIYTVLSTYEKSWDWGDDPADIEGKFTIIKGDFIAQYNEIKEKTDSYINVKGLEILSSI